MRNVFILSALLFPAAVIGSPYLVCTPYPTGQSQPTEFIITVSGSPTPIVSPAVPADPSTAGVRLHADLATWTAGAKTVTVKARNAQGESAASGPFLVYGSDPSVEASGTYRSWAIGQLTQIWLLPDGWSTADIGDVGLAGSATTANGAYTLKGAGADIWDATDAFRFTYRSLTGDGAITARVASLANTDEWAKAGVMIRENLTPNARHAMMVVTPEQGVAFQRRLTTGGTSVHTAGAAVAAPYWVRLTRAGNNWTAYQSADGVTWKAVGSAVTIPMTGALVGLAVTSHNNSALTTAVLDHVGVSP